MSGVRTVESLNVDQMRRCIADTAERLRDTAERIDRIAGKVDQPDRFMVAAQPYTDLAADVVKELTTVLFNMNLSLIITSAGNADTARALGE